MRVLIDTNIILDVLCKRPGLYETSANVIKLCEIGQLDGIVSALSVSNIINILRKRLNPERVREVLDLLFLVFDVVDLKSGDLKRAAEMEFNDFEDAVQVATAIRAKTDYLITRNIKDFAKSSIPVIKPEALLEII